MLFSTGLILVAIGVVVWLWGNRMWLLGAGAGALLGYGLLNLVPALAGGSIGIVVIVGLAILLGCLAFFGKAFAKMVALVVGFVVGGGLAMAALGMLDIGAATATWVVALVAGVIVAVLFSRFLDWSLIVFASLLGSMLIVRGASAAFPDIVSSTAGTAIVVVLTAVGIYYHYRKSRPAG